MIGTFINDQNDSRLIVSYLRVSTIEQAKGFSTANQMNTVKRIAASFGQKIDKHFMDEGKSAFKQNVIRENFDEMIERVSQNKIKTIYVWKLDRLIRNHIKNETLFLMFAHMNVVVVSATEGVLDFTTADGRADIRRKGVENQYESERTGERVKGALLASAELGNYPKSRIPIGYKRIHTEYKAAPLTIDDQTADKVKCIFEKVKETKWGVKKILKWLNSENYLGMKWTEKQVYSLLSNSIYCGIYKDKKDKSNITLHNHTPAIISEDTYFEIQTLIHSRNYENKHKYIFKKFMYCRDCGTPMTPEPAHNGRSKKVFKYYFCKKHKKRINEERIIDFVIDEFNQKIERDNWDETNIKKIVDKLARIDEVLHDNDKLYIEKVISKNYYTNTKSKYLKMRSDHIIELNRIKKNKKIFWEHMSFSAKREWLKENVIKLHYDFENKTFLIEYR